MDLSPYCDPETGEPRKATGDTLAEFIVRELHDTINPDAPDQVQVDQAIGILEQAQEDIEAVVQALRGWRSPRR